MSTDTKKPIETGKLVIVCILCGKNKSTVLYCQCL